MYAYYHYETTKKGIFLALRDASQGINTIYIHRTTSANSFATGSSIG